MWKIINAIDYLDGQKINHGDLKLENVLFWKKDSKSRRVLVKLTAYGYFSAVYVRYSIYICIHLKFSIF
jgi:serine/threonine protein kinase